MGVWEVKQRHSPYKELPVKGYVAGGVTVHARTTRLFAIRPDAGQVFKIQIMDSKSQSHTPTNSGSSGASALYDPEIWPTPPSSSQALASTLGTEIAQQTLATKLSEVVLFEDIERRLREAPACFPKQVREVSVCDLARRYLLGCEEPLSALVERAWGYQSGIAKDVLAVWLLSVLDGRDKEFTFTTECGFMFALLQNTTSESQRKWVKLLARNMTNRGAVDLSAACWVALREPRMAVKIYADADRYFEGMTLALLSCCLDDKTVLQLAKKWHRFAGEGSPYIANRCW